MELSIIITGFIVLYVSAYVIIERKIIANEEKKLKEHIENRRLKLLATIANSKETI